MTFLARLMRLFPIIHFLGFIINLYLGFTHGFFYLIIALFWLYILPLFLNQVHQLFFPLKEDFQDLSLKEYSPWWGTHQLQFLFIVIPQFEQILHIFPGLFSLWLRCWGSRIGKNIYWTPRVEILDRGLVVIGNSVVLGHQILMSSHMVTNIEGKPYLVIKKIRIGDRAFIGVDSQFGPGTTIEAKAKVKPKSRLWWRGEYP